MERCCCRKCMLKELERQDRMIERLVCDQRALRRQVKALSSIIMVSKNGDVTIGSSNNPVNLLYVDTIGSMSQPVGDLFTDDAVRDNFIRRGICLDDNTASIEPPSFTSFPRTWLNNTQQIQNVRTYHYSADAPDRKWIQWFLAQTNIKVMIGITLAAYTSELDVLSADYLADKSKFEGKVLAIAVGNDCVPENISNIQAGITYARQLISEGKLPAVPVTCVLKNFGWFQGGTYPPKISVFAESFKSIAPFLDIVAFNLYDAEAVGNDVPLPVRLSWTSTPTSNPPVYSVTLNGFAAVRFAMQAAGYKQPFWCTEVGWQDGVNNLKTFYTNYLGFNMTSDYTPQESSAVSPPDRIFYFTVRDVPAMNETFGLYKSVQAAPGDALVPKF